jgi:Arc/MetJ-type ribon-helix-helix transcriptional regulator
MKRTTIVLPDELAALLDYERRRRDVPASEVVREALERYLAPARAEGQDDRRFAFFGIGRSGHKGRPGIAESMEEVMAREWIRDDLAGRCDR